MRIGIIGAGNMARALGGRWAEMGHEVMLSGRDRSVTNGVASTLGRGASGGTFADAAAFGRVTLVAVSAEAALDIVRAVGPPDGQVVIDCCNPIDPGDAFRLTTADQPSLAGRIAEAGPAAHVVKAFNLCASTVWEDPASGTGRYVPLAGDDEPAKQAVGGLVRDLGWTPFDLGGLDRAGQLEAVAAVGIRLLSEGVGLESVMPFEQASPD